MQSLFSTCEPSGQLEAELAAGCWLAVAPPATLRDGKGLRRLGGLWRGALRSLGEPYAQLARIDKAAIEDLKTIEL